MITFTLALVLLVVGYWVYGKYVNSLFAPDSTRNLIPHVKRRL